MCCGPSMLKHFLSLGTIPLDHNLITNSLGIMLCVAIGYTCVAATVFYSRLTYGVISKGRPGSLSMHLCAATGYACASHLCAATVFCSRWTHGFIRKDHPGAHVRSIPFVYEGSTCTRSAA
ncbi:hypothetical protein SESBI_39221 [Sesbania bispinosa]|nr:hypothetical protein SESBI_39221 [Sesbania bispinosa]